MSIPLLILALSDKGDEEVEKNPRKRKKRRGTLTNNNKRRRQHRELTSIKSEHELLEKMKEEVISDHDDDDEVDQDAGFYNEDLPETLSAIGGVKCELGDTKDEDLDEGSVPIMTVDPETGALVKQEPKSVNVKPDPDDPDGTKNGDKSGPAKCPKCTRVFQYVKRFEQHLPKCDGRLRVNKVYVPKKPWEKVNKRKEKEDRGDEVCPLCMKQWNSYLKPLENHINMHRERITVDSEVKCPECPPDMPGNSFKKLDLNKHFMEVHQTENRVCICCECFQVFNEKKTMTFHFERHHNIIPNNILCTECGKGFAFQHQVWSLLGHFFPLFILFFTKFIFLN